MIYQSLHLKEQFTQYENSVRSSFVVPSQMILVDGDPFSKHWKTILQFSRSPKLIWKDIIYNLLEAEIFTVDANLKASVCTLSEVKRSTAHRGCQ